MKALERLIQACENNQEIEWLPGIQNTREARRRLKDLEAKAYTIHDYIGKTVLKESMKSNSEVFMGKGIFM